MVCGGVLTLLLAALGSPGVLPPAQFSPDVRSHFSPVVDGCDGCKSGLAQVGSLPSGMTSTFSPTWGGAPGSCVLAIVQIEPEVWGCVESTPCKYTGSSGIEIGGILPTDIVTTWFHAAGLGLTGSTTYNGATGLMTLLTTVPAGSTLNMHCGAANLLVWTVRVVRAGQAYSAEFSLTCKPCET